MLTERRVDRVHHGRVFLFLLHDRFHALRRVDRCCPFGMVGVGLSSVKKVMSCHEAVERCLHLDAQTVGNGDEMSQIIEVGAFISVPVAHLRCVGCVEEHLSRDRSHVYRHVGESEVVHLLQIEVDAFLMAESAKVSLTVDPHYRAFCGLCLLRVLVQRLPRRPYICRHEGHNSHHSRFNSHSSRLNSHSSCLEKFCFHN